MEKFSESKYKQQYSKEHYKKFNVDLKIEEFELLNKLLKEKNVTKVQFVRDAIKNLKLNK